MVMTYEHGHTEKRLDELKRRYCSDNGISLLVIPYWDFEKIGGVIDGLISKVR